ncbi:inactive polypeptide N-acetylgalactosaminyltransferase-like protein 5 isoform X2 [Vicugna pacos]|uniref:Inactive polypeptide N-acetylgalactosaminyltransferase-like protein 5 isoform X2 n=1 Tax=Vicugna pacos TaxID=30538 RepID=A0ABM5DHD0_VICPA|nr:inactive polypeptide N-acetylgalactosaminyltransferase-like protein 5 isoform X1 [Vicugna pacos]
MRNVIIKCLLCGSFTFGIWTAVFTIYFRNNHVGNQEKIPLKKEDPFIWSLGEKLQEQTFQGSEQIPRPHVSTGSSSKDEIKEQKPILKLRDDFNYLDPELFHGFLKYGLNSIISKRLGSYRDVPDTRDKLCHRKQYPVTLPTASIIICFHNEEFNALMRTVSSVMSLTPHHILEEIILVDDMSEYDDLKEKLDYHLEIFRGKIKIIRNKKREGLIRARLVGASHASGDVLVFLDSHCEVNKVWLEPLLHAIDKDPKMVVCPLIDVIDDMTLEYKPSPVVRGAFNWHLQFKWDLIFSYELNGPEGPTRPIRSPAMVGGIFAINRHYFYELGQYDKGMNLWGGENMEISLRIWMCGGQLLIIPCSRVGHVVKQHITNQTEVAKALAFNSLRVVHVWLDDYKEQFFLRRPDLKSLDYGNISERVELRKRLGCKSFQWYLDTVFPELETAE